MKLTDSPEEIRKGYRRMILRVYGLIAAMLVWLAVSLVIFAPFAESQTGLIVLLIAAGGPEIVLWLLLGLAARCPHCGTAVWLQLRWNPKGTVCAGCHVDWKTGKPVVRPRR